MDASTDGQEKLAKSIKLGVGALVVLASAAVVAGGIWYFRGTSVPTCGSPDTTGTVLKIISENFTKDLAADNATTMAKTITFSLDLVEKGELSSDGNVRKCSAQLSATLNPDMKSFASTIPTDWYAGLQKDSDDKFSVPIVYDVKALDGQSSKSMVSTPGSLPVGMLKSAVTMLAVRYEPTKPVAVTGPSNVDTAPSAVDVKAIIRTSAQLSTVPLNADYTARSWDELAATFPHQQWTEDSDGGFAVSKKTDVAQGVRIVAKGARTMILQTEIDRSFNSAEEPNLLLSAFEATFIGTPLRCDSQEGASNVERWYRVSPSGSKPVIVKYEFSAGNAGGSEVLTFEADAKMPDVGGDAIDGKWTDKCER